MTDQTSNEPPGPPGSGLPPVPFDGGRDVTPIAIEDEMRRSYLDYAMSVIVARALPDARDGLKPVHRRILYAMNEGGYVYNRPYRKSAAVVGDVLGQYHPHGGDAVYEALVRLAQDFAMRLPLLDPQGNFGSMDGDPPAAMRYTEIRMGQPAHALLQDIDEEVVDFQETYDGQREEPRVLPARFPNLLVNGAGGIAVGMATNIPPHNLGEVVDACLAFLDDPDLSALELMAYVRGPDFPTGGLILGTQGIRSAYLTGRGSVVMRGRTHVETIRKDREAIVITEIPYQVNKASMVERIADGIRAKKIEGISDLRDETNRHGVRVVIELKRDAMADVVLNQLYRHSQLQTSFGVNALALDLGRPVMMDLRQFVATFLEFREEVIARRSRYRLRKARERAHVLVGLAVAVANLDEVIALIRNAADPAIAREQLMAREWPIGDIAPLLALVEGKAAGEGALTYRLSEEQARAILELRLQRLTGLGREELADELRQLVTQIEDLLDILRNRGRLIDLIRDDLRAVREQFATPRRTEILENEGEFDDEDLIQREDMVVTVSLGGYVKRVPLVTYRAQRRGGKGRSGMSTREDDAVGQIFVASTHTPVLFFTSVGMAYQLKVWRLPAAAPQARGKALVNLLPLREGEKVTAIMPLPEDQTSWSRLHAVFVTARGNVRRNVLSDFVDVRSNGKIAMKFEGEDADDRLIAVAPCREDQDVVLAMRSGRAIRFSVDDVRVFAGRSSTGVRGIRLDDGDEVVSLCVLDHVDATPAELRAYLRLAAQARRADGEDDVQVETASDTEDEDGEEDIALEGDRFAELAGREEFLLTITANGFGKRTSAFEYRLTGRGGKGIIAIQTSARNGPLVAAMPVTDRDHIVMVTDGGQLIRSPVHDIRIAGRNTQGVTLFRTAEDERVVSVGRLEEADEDGDDVGAEGPGGEGGPGTPADAGLPEGMPAPEDHVGEDQAGEGQDSGESP